MRYRIFILIALTLILGMTAIGTASFDPEGGRNAQQPEGSRVPVSVTQLPGGKAGIPVEVRCDPARLSAPNELHSYSCVIKNHTDQSIRSFSIIFTIVNERDGEELRVSRFIAYDMLIHPDFNDPAADKLIPPKGEHTVRSAGSTSIENVVIKGVEVKLDHVEFDGSAVLGGNEGGLNIVARRREGAAKFKHWLKRQYAGRGRSVNAILALIERQSEAPPEVGAGDDALEQGAEMYRLLLLKRYNTRGAGELEKVLSN